jgi:hypothetical protein
MAWADPLSLSLRRGMQVMAVNDRPRSRFWRTMAGRQAISDKFKTEEWIVRNVIADYMVNHLMKTSRSSPF